MLNIIDTVENKQRVAIVAVGYNRPKALSRLLNSLESASYPEENIPLVISIDCSGNEEVYSIANSFQWTHGDKYVNIETEGRLGLVKHVYQCADLTNAFRAIILLEDDIFVSPHFYTFVLQALDKYGDEAEIAQIALYNNETNGFVGQPFPKINDGADVFLSQSACTWGECWNRRMWKEFCSWRDNVCTDDIINAQDMPSQIKRWTRAWSRFFNGYLLHNNKYVLYPQTSVTTNFSDAGEHGDGNNNIVQVSLQQGSFVYRMPKSKDMQRYDSFGNNESLYKWLSMNPDEICLDIYGLHERTKQRYILSTRQLPYKVIKSFALNMRPIELNVKYNVLGKGLYLYDTTEQGNGNGNFSKYLGEYYFQRLNSGLLIQYLKIFFGKTIKVRFKKLIKR